MRDDRLIGFSDADAAAVASVVHRVAKANAELAAAQAALAHALADGVRIASAQAAASPSRVRDRDMALRAIAAELAGESRISDRTMQSRMSAADQLAHDYPATLTALAEGRIHQGHVRLIVEQGLLLPPERRPALEAQALRWCETDTPGRVRARVQLLAERLHPRTLTERHVEAREKRGVFVSAGSDGMCELTAVLPAILGEAIHDRLTRQGRALADERTGAAERLRAARTAREEEAGDDLLLASDGRTMDQLRADLLCDMLLTAQPGADPTSADNGPGALGAIRAHVQVVVPATTLLGADEHPAELAGRSPVDADTARRLAGGSCTGWDRILTDPVTGQVIATDRRHVPPALRRQIHARDGHCRFPGCIVPAIRCEIDHVADWAHGGPTHMDNLQALCQRHHSMKQFTAWKVRQLDHGVILWTSPLGKTYTDEPPPPAVHFAPDHDEGTDHERDEDHDDDEPPPWEHAASQSRQEDRRPAGATVTSSGRT